MVHGLSVLCHVGSLPGPGIELGVLCTGRILIHLCHQSIIIFKKCQYFSNTLPTHTYLRENERFQYLKATLKLSVKPVHNDKPPRRRSTVNLEVWIFTLASESEESCKYEICSLGVALCLNTSSGTLQWLPTAALQTPRTMTRLQSQ